MTERRLLPVQPDVIKEVLVERVLEQVLARLPPDAPATVATALHAELEFAVTDGGRLDLSMRDIGYLTRVIEAEMFEPARAALAGLADQLSQRIASGLDWVSATRAACFEFARREPLPKPSPDDADAVSWRVPGPGGHVRHYVVAAAIAELLSGSQPDLAPPTLPPDVVDAGELKRCWTYGFTVRCCEEALPPEQPGV